MGLKDQPEFESMTEPTTTTAEKEPTMAKTATQDAAVASATAATTAIAKAGANAVTTPAAKFEISFKDKNNVFDTATVEGLSLAAPRIKGEQGSFFMGEKDLGAAIQFELISFNNRWAIGTGTDDREAKDYFRVSFDNETISGHPGLSVAAYIESLQAQGFAKAKASPYLDVFCFITWSEKTGPIPVEEREICILQCSQTSLGAFTAFATTRGLLESKGLAKPLDVIEAHAEKRVSGANKYTNFSFHAPKAK